MPIVTVGLIVVSGMALYYQWLDVNVTRQYAFVASKLISREVLRDPGSVLATLVTSLFLHAGLTHILMNMLFLWVFGDNVEDKLGKIRFIVFYLACGVAANLAQAIFTGFGPMPTIGASGAVAGVLGAYFISFKGSRIHTFIFPWSIFTGLIPIPARFFIVLWFIMQVFASFRALAGEVTNVAWFAHIGGFLAGWVLCRWMCPKPSSRGRGPRLEWIRER